MNDDLEVLILEWCSPWMSGFGSCDHEANGKWSVDVVYGGEDVVYSKEAYGNTVYLWQETVDDDTMWVMGNDHTADSYWGYRRGSDLFDPCDSDDGECASWHYWNDGQWSTHSIEPEISCSAADEDEDEDVSLSLPSSDTIPSEESVEESSGMSYVADRHPIDLTLQTRHCIF